MSLTRVRFAGDFDGIRCPRPRSSGIVDTGGVFYAPATMAAPDGRKLMWGWIQETASQGELDIAGFAGALSIPREFELQNERLIVRPARELAALWGDPAHEVEDIWLLSGEDPAALPPVAGPCRIEVALSATDAYTVIVIEEAEGAALTIAVDGRAPRERLVILDAVQGETGETVLEAASTIAGGMTLDIYVDHTIVEIFASTGETMTLRRSGPGIAAAVRIECRMGSAHLQHARISPMQPPPGECNDLHLADQKKYRTHYARHNGGEGHANT